MVSIIVLLIVFILIAVRRIGNIRFQIWQIMSLGAIAVIISGRIAPLSAIKAINLDVMFFLFGMFIVGEALKESGYISDLSYHLFGKAKTLDGLVLLILFGMGIMAAFLMNDTLAIIGTPVVLILATKVHARSQILLLALAFAITIGSVMSPIGNPQNLLIAINSKLPNPFITFSRYLILPTLLNLLLAYGILRLFYRKDFDIVQVQLEPEPLKDPTLATITKISLVILIILVLAKIVTVFLGWSSGFRLTYIALAAALPIFIFSPKRFTIMRKIDWSTLIFFAAMFILMESVWNAGIVQSFITGTSFNLTSIVMILLVSIILSQFISNVPLVALYLPMLTKIGVTTPELMALAAGSTIAGNLSILGAASNVIIIQNAEKKYGETLTFLEFMKIGLPLTILNSSVYWLFFRFF